MHPLFKWNSSLTYDFCYLQFYFCDLFKIPENKALNKKNTELHQLLRKVLTLRGQSWFSHQTCSLWSSSLTLTWSSRAALWQAAAGSCQGHARIPSVSLRSHHYQMRQGQSISKVWLTNYCEHISPIFLFYRFQYKP